MNIATSWNADTLLAKNAARGTKVRARCPRSWALCWLAAPAFRRSQGGDGGRRGGADPAADHAHAGVGHYEITAPVGGVGAGVVAIGDQRKLRGR